MSYTLSEFQKRVVESSSHEEESSPTDDAYERLKAMLGPEHNPQPKTVKMKKEERIALFQSLRDELRDGADPDETAMNVVKLVDEFLEEKSEGTSKGNLGSPIFRRVE